MIESLSLGGAIALTRSFALSPAADLPVDRSRERSASPPDPDAPSGPAPSFKTSTMEAMRAALRVEDSRAVSPELRGVPYTALPPEPQRRIDTFA